MAEAKIPTTTQELLAMYQEGVPKPKSEVDITKLRYAIYARKSTTDDERQERSIPDQIHDCVEKVVKPDNLTVIGKPIKEKCSAKDPDIREHFRSLIDQVKQGKIDGIISWHPDRLSRNMKEAGEIIDLLDKGILKDLRFATSTFENSPTGKMLLGISFVLSKQYSEHLSESVTRGNKRIIEDGYVLFKHKHGYVIDKDRRLYPDGDNFLIIRKVFEKRIEGVSQPEIVKWLNTTGYTVRPRNKPPQAYTWDKDSVSKLLKDPVYAGVLKYGNHHTDLTRTYDFTPVVTVEEFFKVNRVDSFESSRVLSLVKGRSRDTQANLLRGKVVCVDCMKPMSSGLTPKQLKDGTVKYYYYKCETDGCKNKNKSVRAKVVLRAVYDFFEEYLFTTKDNYKNYLDDAKAYIKRKQRQLKSEIMSITRKIELKEKDFEETKQLIKKSPNLAEYYDLKKMSTELEDLRAVVAKLSSKYKDSFNAVPTYKQYLELFENLSVNLRKIQDMDYLNNLLPKFFSNFYMKREISNGKQGWKVSLELKEPWLGFVKTGNFVRGRPKANNFEPHLESILFALNQSWDSSNYEKDTAPVIALIDEKESSNQIKGKIYAY